MAHTISPREWAHDVCIRITSLIRISSFFFLWAVRSTDATLDQVGTSQHHERSKLRVSAIRSS